MDAVPLGRAVAMTSIELNLVEINDIAGLVAEAP